MPYVYVYNLYFPFTYNPQFDSHLTEFLRKLYLIIFAPRTP